MKITNGLSCALFTVLALFLYSCGGGGDSASEPNIGVVVDPYITGAIFQEVYEDDTLGQISTPSNNMGQFKFEKSLTKGSVIVMLEKGVHNGSPYLGSLKAQEHHVDAQGRLIVSPLTTLLSNYEKIGYTPTEAETKVVTLLDNAGITLAPADMVKDSMEEASQSGDLKPLQANMSVNSFLQALKLAGRQGFDVDNIQTYEADLLTFQQLLTDLVGMILTNLSSSDLAPLKPEIEAMLGDAIPVGYELDLNDLILAAITSSDYTAGQIAEDLLVDGIIDVPVQNWVEDKSLKKLILLNFVSRSIDNVDFEAFYTNCRNNNKDLPEVISGETFPPDDIPRYWYSANFATVLKPMVKMDNKGNAIAIWEQRNPSEWSIFVSHYSVGQGWDEPILIENEAGGGLNPFLAIDDDGNAMAIWEQADGEYMSIMTSYYTFGGGWDTPEYIEENNLGHAHSPELAFDGAGNAIAVWYASDGICTQGSQTFGTSNVYTNRFVKGVGWDNAELLDNEECWGSGYNGYDVVMDDAGNGLAVWTQGDGAQYNLNYRTYTPGSGWGAAGLVEYNPDSVYDPQLAIDGAGNIMVVWYQMESGSYDVWANRFDVSSGWGGAEKIENTDRHAMGARIGMDSSGNAIAVWYQYSDTGADIKSNRYIVGSGWGTEEVVDSQSQGHAYSPQIAVNSKGDALVAWEHNTTNFDVWAVSFDAKNGWGEPKIIDSDTSGDAEDPSVALSRLGTGVAVWLQTGGVVANDYR